ncbi:S8/S53 family peptidase [Paraflavitalea speifideaquila]|uniref:S8 family peptidase n=1 Tax=Paraflavitalea speifideaquila TaxID=3076558 RepID=UPI0028E84B8D|nr:S8/S53 family peptidase [Paraflavitalea speifideiaquila]
MKVTVKDRYLNVRVGHPSVNADCFQYIAPGSEIDVDGQLYKGDVLEGIDTWLKDGAGNYYWSGGVSHDQVTFSWFNRLSIRRVWDKYHERGDQAKVAILDTGFLSTNTEIAGKIAATNIIIDKTKYPNLPAFVMNDQSTDAHGSRTTSLVGALNNRNWIVGIAPACQLIAGKISVNKEMRDFNYIIKGIKWAIEQGADIISISYSIGDLTDQEVKDFNAQVKQLVANKNVLIFAASGNAGADPIHAERYPASFDDCVSVGATNAAGNISSITIISDKTIIHAPGVDIEAYDTQNMPSPASGTSFATPIVAAIAALAVSYLKKKRTTPTIGIKRIAESDLQYGRHDWWLRYKKAHQPL